MAIEKDLTELRWAWERAALERRGRALQLDDIDGLFELLETAGTELVEQVAGETATWAEGVRAAVGELHSMAGIRPPL